MRERTKVGFPSVPFVVVFAFVAGACQVELQEEPVVDQAPEAAAVTAQVNETPAMPLSEEEEAAFDEPLPEPHIGTPVTVDMIRARGPRIHCVPEPAGTVTSIGTIAGSTWTVERLVRENAPCEYDVRLRNAEGEIEVLPLTPGAYYFAIGRVLEDRTLLVLTHIAHGEFQVEDSGRLATRDVDPTIIALTKQGEAWSKVSTVVDRDEAVWASGLTVDLKMTYFQDSLFEHMLFVQQGRPPSDGKYEVQLNLLPSGEVIASNPQRIGDYGMSGEYGP